MQTSIHTYPFRSTSRQSIEEVVNTSTHALGLLVSIGGLAVLVVFASIFGTASHIVGASIYGSTLVLVYAASTGYHWPTSNEGKQSLRSAEQGVIFLFIAGTYTPFTLAVLGGGWGWSLFGVVWGLAIAGIILNLIYFPPLIEVYKLRVPRNGLALLGRHRTLGCQSPVHWTDVVAVGWDRLHSRSHLPFNK